MIHEFQLARCFGPFGTRTQTRVTVCEFIKLRFAARLAELTAVAAVEMLKDPPASGLIAGAGLTGVLCARIANCSARDTHSVNSCRLWVCPLLAEAAFLTFRAALQPSADHAISVIRGRKIFHSLTHNNVYCHYLYTVVNVSNRLCGVLLRASVLVTQRSTEDHKIEEGRAAIF